MHIIFISIYICKVWEVDTGIRVEGPLLTCAESIEDWPGARYCKALSVEFPYFEVSDEFPGQLVLMINDDLV